MIQMPLVYTALKLLGHQDGDPDVTMLALKLEIDVFWDALFERERVKGVVIYDTQQSEITVDESLEFQERRLIVAQGVEHILKHRLQGTTTKVGYVIPCSP